MNNNGGRRSKRELLCDAILLRTVGSKNSLLVAFFVLFLSLLFHILVRVFVFERNMFSVAFVEMVECCFCLPIIVFVVVLIMFTSNEQVV